MCSEENPKKNKVKGGAGWIERGQKKEKRSFAGKRLPKQNLCGRGGEHTLHEKKSTGGGKKVIP